MGTCHACCNSIVYLVPGYCLVKEHLPCDCVFHDVEPSGNKRGARPPLPTTGAGSSMG